MAYLPQISKKKIVFVLTSLLLIYALYWLANHSFIQVSLTGDSGSQKITYTVQDVDTGRSKIVEGGSQARFLVKRGAYQVSAKVNGTSFYAFVGNTPRFLKSYRTGGELAPESERVFVGENPRGCPAYTGTILVSGGCGGIYGEVSIHQPSSDQQASYVVSNPDRSTFGENMLMMTTQNGLLTIIKTPESEQEGLQGHEDVPPSYVAITSDQNFSPVSKVTLSSLDGNKSYIFQQTSEGEFIASDYVDGEIHHFKVSDINNAPLKKKLQKPETEKVSFRGADADKNSGYAALYSHTGDAEGKGAISEVVLSNGKSSARHLLKDKEYINVRLCGNSILCLLSRDGMLDVYDASSQNLSRKFSAANVSAIEMLNGRLLAVSNEGVINIDVGSQKGFMGYSLGRYRFAELSKGINNYILSIKGLDQRKVGLLVNRGIRDTDSIDKKVLELQAMPEIEFVSVYQKNIYVSGNLGELVYRSEIDGYGYDPARKQAVAKLINETVDKLGIDRNRYTVSSNAF